MYQQWYVITPYGNGPGNAGVGRVWKHASNAPPPAVPAARAGQLTARLFISVSDRSPGRSHLSGSDQPGRVRPKREHADNNAYRGPG